MSTDDPGRPRSRRRIAGERRPRTERSSDPASSVEAPAAEPTTPSGVTETTAPTPATRTDDTATDTPGDGADHPEDRAAGPGREGPSWLLVGALGALALVLVVAVAVLGLGTWDVREVREQDRVEQATREAPAAAERASVAILSYSHTSLDADQRAAQRYMTPTYRKKYAKTFDRLVRPNAGKVKANVEAEVKASGVVQADSDRADVLLYVNQTTTSTANGGEPQVALNRVQVSMVERDGRWLVNDITSY